MSTILGIESTAHTFGVAVVKDGKVLSNVKETYTTESGGIIPMDAAAHHANHKNEIYFDALESSGINEKDIDAVAFSQGPGLAPCLLEGLKFMKEVATKLKKPVVPVNHCVAHLEVGKLSGAKDPVMLYASGANTQVIAYAGNTVVPGHGKVSRLASARKSKQKLSSASGKYRVFGETLDIGIGNFIDTFARYAGIGFPGGPVIQKLAENAGNKDELIELPYSVKGMDISLSGILTNLKQKLESEKYKLEDLAYSLQETVFAMLVEVSERALAHTGKKELLLGGGVGCNTRLQEMCRVMCKERGAKFFTVDNALLVDNAAMIAFLGEIMFKKGVKVQAGRAKDVDILPRQRTDDVDVVWK